jgi:hypothetical protein
LLLLVLGAFLLLREPSGPSPEELQATSAAQTVAAQLTEMSIQETIAPPVTDTPAPPTDTPTPTVTSTPEPPTVTPTVECKDQAGNVIDVTVPDDTYYPPSQAFTKTWRVKNTGTCTWTTSYALVFDSGNIMGGPTSKALASSVPPGASIDISVSLTSPASNGTHRGNWKLRNDKGVIFGLGGGGPFWVQIVVGPTPTTSPGVYKTAQFAVHTSKYAELDSGEETDSGGDFLYEADSPTERYIAPKDGATMRKMSSVPEYKDCKAASLSSSKIATSDFPVGSWMCYKTSDGRYGRFTLDNYGTGGDYLTMYIDIRTWNK